MFVIACVAGGLLGGGCDGGGCDGSAATAAARQRALTRAQAAMPQDQRLADLYEHSCRSCHTQVDTGAPLAQDRSAWDSRWDKGMSALLQSVMAGRNGMPPSGQCFACSSQDLEALTKFLAGRE